MKAGVGFESCTMLGYSFEESIADDLRRSTRLRFGAITVGATAKQCSRYEFVWNISPTVPDQSRSETAEMLDTARTDSMGRDHLILERNIADLVTMHIGHAASQGRTLILARGPLLSKVIGRLGYRCLKEDTVFGFLSWPDVCKTTSAMGVRLQSGWYGPHPSFHDDSNVRTFSYMGSGAMPVRLDLFSQAFGDSDRARGSAAQISANVNAVKRVIAAEPFKHPAGIDVQVPADLGLLSRSLHWSDERLKKTLSHFGPRMHSPTDKERIDAIEKEGILGLRRWTLPKSRASEQTSLLHRGDIGESEYLREHLFYGLDLEAKRFGEEEGVKRFVRSFHQM